MKGQQRNPMPNGRKPPLPNPDSATGAGPYPAPAKVRTVPTKADGDVLQVSRCYDQRELENGAGALYLGPVPPSSCGKRRSRRFECDSPLQKRISGHPVLSSILRCRGIVVADEGGLVQAVVSGSGFILPNGHSGPRPKRRKPAHVYDQVNHGGETCDVIGDGARALPKKYRLP